MQPSALPLPPTSPSLSDGNTRPYFLWWTDATVADLRVHLADPSPEARAHWLGAAIRREMEAAGNGIGMADYLVAGVCLAHRGVGPAHPQPRPLRAHARPDHQRALSRPTRDQVDAAGPSEG
jgi:hypothetical protein